MRPHPTRCHDATTGSDPACCAAEYELRKVTVEMIESFCIWLVGKTVSDTTTKIAGKVGQRHPFTYALVATALSLIVPLVLSTSGQRAEVLPQWLSGSGSSPRARKGFVAMTKVLFDAEDESSEEETDGEEESQLALAVLRKKLPQLSKDEVRTLLQTHSNDPDRALKAARGQALDDSGAAEAADDAEEQERLLRAASSPPAMRGKA